jgi:hypothetical protein
MEQPELDPPDPSNKPHTRSVVVRDDVDSLPPVVIEVEVEKDGPVQLALSIQPLHVE